MSHNDVQQPNRWYTLGLSELRAKLNIGEKGLSQSEAVARIEHFGRNELPHRPPPTRLEILLRQFQSPLIYLLGVAAVVAIVLGDYKDAGFIAAVLIVNAGIGGYQEWQAEQSSRALQKLLNIRATVERDGEVVELDAEELVPGDYVWLESGGRVPADLRLISAHGLEIDESLLTGESMAVHKDSGWMSGEDVPLGDRLNMAYAGSVVVRGRATDGRATGGQTTIGQLGAGCDGRQRRSTSACRADGKVQPKRGDYYRVGSGGRGLGWGHVSRLYGYRDVLFATLAVSAIPEGLPAALTVARRSQRPGWLAAE